jgi:hypothetical protein
MHLAHQFAKPIAELLDLLMQAERKIFEIDNMMDEGYVPESVHTIYRDNLEDIFAKVKKIEYHSNRIEKDFVIQHSD